MVTVPVVENMRIISFRCFQKEVPISCFSCSPLTRICAGQWCSFYLITMAYCYSSMGMWMENGISKNLQNNEHRYFPFLLKWCIFPGHSNVVQVPVKAYQWRTFGVCWCKVFASCIPFLSPIRQCWSSEGIKMKEKPLTCTLVWQYSRTNWVSW